MPKILERLVNQLESKGYNKSQAFAIGTSSLQKAGDLKPGSQEPTAKGTKRGNMTPEARAASRREAPVGQKPRPSGYNKTKVHVNK